MVKYNRKASNIEEALHKSREIYYEEMRITTMTFNAIIISEIGNQDQPFAYAITDDEGNLVSEKHDHGLSNVLTATAITVKKCANGVNDYVQTMHGTDIKIDVYVTDSRVAILCKKYDKGGGWTGGLTALALNAGSKILAAHRRKGKVLIGHIRYEWLCDIAYQAKISWLTSDCLRIFYKDAEKNQWCLELTFKKGTDSAFIANDILRRASKYRLEMTDEKGEKETAFFAKYSTGSGKIPLTDDPKNKLSIIAFPNSYFAPKGEDKRPNW